MFVFHKSYILIEFLKELMLMEQVHQMSVLFVTTDIS